ncbi:DEAD/DEAH box helicase [Burkholderia cepacia]|uniref:DEAD/DEAH box helicase n=1 Tax=Burkholderia cepacia TaxID=292 RepID=UPI0015892C2C|nr:DEAD/DEAH box helicase [Burkholderia cepacia]
MPFTSLGLIEPLLRHLQGLDYQTPETVRVEAIPAAPSGEYVMAAAETGTGKTAVLRCRCCNASSDTARRCRATARVLAPAREPAEQELQSFVESGKALEEAGSDRDCAATVLVTRRAGPPIRGHRAIIDTIRRAATFSVDHRRRRMPRTLLDPRAE